MAVVSLPGYRPPRKWIPGIILATLICLAIFIILIVALWGDKTAEGFGFALLGFAGVGVLILLFVEFEPPIKPAVEIRDYEEGEQPTTAGGRQSAVAV